MSVSIAYADWWEAFEKNGVSYQVYGRTSVSIPSWDNVEASWEWYFDCTWFTSNTYAFCVVMQVENTGNSSTTASIRMDIREWTTTVNTPVNTTTTIAAWATKAFKVPIKYNIVSWLGSNLNVRFLAWDLDGTVSDMYAFEIYTAPWWIDCYSGVWKWLLYDWSLLATFYEKDMDQTISSVSALKTFEPYNSVSTFDLSNCGVWSGVWCFAVYWENSYTSSKSLSSITLKLQALKSWWVDRKTKTLSGSISAWWYRWWYFEFNVLPWEIWTDASTYRVTWSWTVWTDTWNINEQFYISNLNIDDTQHDPWYMRVEWTNLCYTDWYGYKHKIETDTIGSYVWREKAWFIRLDGDEPLWIYYISSQWLKCRTSKFNDWYWWTVNVWSGKAWFTRVSSWTTASNARYCLCMIGSNGQKRRIINHWES